jgi:hypothetical protein
MLSGSFFPDADVANILPESSGEFVRFLHWGVRSKIEADFDSSPSKAKGLTLQIDTDPERSNLVVGGVKITVSLAE